MNTIFGYWRCSTDAQDQERQIRSLKDAGVEVLRGDKITGTSDYADRKELSKLLEEIQEGDLLILDELSRLGRTMKFYPEEESLLAITKNYLEVLSK